MEIAGLLNAHSSAAAAPMYLHPFREQPLLRWATAALIDAVSACGGSLPVQVVTAAADAVPAVQALQGLQAQVVTAAADAVPAVQALQGLQAQVRGVPDLDAGLLEVLGALSAPWVLIHDPLRPGLSAAVLDQVMAAIAAEQARTAAGEASRPLAAVVPVLPLVETVKRVSRPLSAAQPADPAQPALVLQTVPREGFVVIGAPYAVRTEAVRQALATAGAWRLDPDPAALVRLLLAAGEPVLPLPVDDCGPAIATPDDALSVAASAD